MTITEVSKKYNISADTLRYYERIGLLPPVNRGSNGNRDYTEKDCMWVNFVKCMRSAGLSIEILIEYVSLFQKGDNTIPSRKNLLVEQRENVREKITELQTMLEYLDKKIDGYETHLLKYEEKLANTDDK